jgi:hypothetical protein
MPSIFNDSVNMNLLLPLLILNKLLFIFTLQRNEIYEFILFFFNLLLTPNNTSYREVMST